MWPVDGLLPACQNSVREHEDLGGLGRELPALPVKSVEESLKRDLCGLGREIAAPMAAAAALARPGVGVKDADLALRVRIDDGLGQFDADNPSRAGRRPTRAGRGNGKSTPAHSQAPLTGPLLGNRAWACRAWRFRLGPSTSVRSPEKKRRSHCHGFSRYGSRHRQRCQLDQVLQPRAPLRRARRPRRLLHSGCIRDRPSWDRCTSRSIRVRAHLFR